MLIILMILMIADYYTGMLASKAEAFDNPDNPDYGWNSKKGAKGILKKFGYVAVIMVSMVLDYVILILGTYFGFESNIKAFFGLMVAIWYVLNELLSIIENAGRMGMGAHVPEWLLKYIAVLKDKVDNKYNQED